MSNMSDEMQSQVRRFKFAVEEEYKRLRGVEDGDDEYAALIARAVDVLGDLYDMSYGQKPWRSIR